MKGATPQNIDFTSTPNGKAEYGQSPKFREDECHKCGVEDILYRGTDPVTGILLYVGDKCRWYIKRSEDFTVIK